MYMNLELTTDAESNVEYTPIACFVEFDETGAIEIQEPYNSETGGDITLLDEGEAELLEAADAEVQRMKEEGDFDPDWSRAEEIGGVWRW